MEIVAGRVDEAGRDGQIGGAGDDVAVVCGSVGVVGGGVAVKVIVAEGEGNAFGVHRPTARQGGVVMDDRAVLQGDDVGGEDGRAPGGGVVVEGVVAHQEGALVVHAASTVLRGLITIDDVVLQRGAGVLPHVDAGAIVALAAGEVEVLDHGCDGGRPRGAVDVDHPAELLSVQHGGAVAG